MQIDIALTKPQREFALSTYPHPAIIGGLGSGKSEAGIIRVVLLMLENYSKIGKSVDTLITFPTYDLCRLRGIPGTEEVLDRIGLSYKTNKSEFRIDIKPFGSILFRSYDRPERLVAFEVGHSVCDEIDTLPIDKAKMVWRKISERTRQKCYRKNSIGAVTTPDHGIHGFCYWRWVKKAGDEYQLVKAPTATNPYLPDGYIDQIRANYDERLADLYLNGEFVSLTDSKVYHFFDRARHHNDRVIKQGDRLHVGLDFNIGGTCSTVWVIDSNKPIAVDEFISHDTQDFVNNLTRYNGHNITVFPDASGGSNSTNASATDIEIIQRAGYAVDAPNKNPFVRDRINSINSLLSHDMIAVNTDKCVELTHALESQGYNDKGDPEKFNEHPAIDDWNDCAGYFISRRFPIQSAAAAVRMAF